MPIDIQPIICQYRGLDAARAQSLGGAGGFSGARLWGLSLDQDNGALGNSLPSQHLYPSQQWPSSQQWRSGQQWQFCLRRWPAEHPTIEHLQWMHNLLAHTFRLGLTFVPVPMRNQSAKSFCEHGGHLWEVAPWMPGRADFCATADDSKRQTRLTNAMQALALWHNAAATFKPVTTDIARGIRTRLQRHQELRTGKLDELRRHVRENRYSLASEVVATAQALVDAFAVTRDLGPDLNRLSTVAVSMQPCIRDIWHDHVLFTGDEVTGIVDFGAARVAAREGDVARLLGSLSSSASSEQSAQQLWDLGLSAYQETAALPLHAEMVEVWHRANRTMSGLQWVEWLFSDGRRFDDLDAVHRRMAGFLAIQKRP